MKLRQILLLLIIYTYSFAETINNQSSKLSNHEQFLYGVKYDSVIGPAVSVLYLEDFNDTKDMFGNNYLFGGELGLNGGKAQVGYGFFYWISLWGKVSLMRTWYEPREIKPNQTYLGVEGQLTLMALNFSVGMYQHISGSDTDNNKILTGSVGLGW